MFTSLTSAILCVLPLVTGLMTTTTDSPSFCHGLDCPKFSVLETTDDYELRAYEAGSWISTTEKGYGYDKAVSKGFWKLFKYIGGNNADGEKIAMTAPVRTRIAAGDGPFCKDHFTISFFVPFKFQSKPPEPSDPEVFVEHIEAFEAYVGSFSGWNSVQSITENASHLYHVLGEKGKDVESKYFYSVGYDSPFRLLDRHNEVWLVKTSKTAQEVLSVQ